MPNERLQSGNPFFQTNNARTELVHPGPELVHRRLGDLLLFLRHADGRVDRDWHRRLLLACCRPSWWEIPPAGCAWPSILLGLLCLAGESKAREALAPLPHMQLQTLYSYVQA